MSKSDKKNIILSIVFSFSMIAFGIALATVFINLAK